VPSRKTPKSSKRTLGGSRAFVRVGGGGDRVGILKKKNPRLTKGGDRWKGGSRRPCRKREKWFCNIGLLPANGGKKEVGNGEKEYFGIVPRGVS